MAIRCHVAVTTYNRPHMLRRLLHQIEEQSLSRALTTTVYVHDDHSNQREIYKPEGIEVYHTYHPDHYGKKRYWVTINDILREACALSKQWDYFFLLQDDLELENDFFRKMWVLWNLIKDDRKVALNPFMIYSDKGVGNWTGIPPKIIHLNGGYQVYKVGWIDCIFMSDFSGLNRLAWHINTIHEHRWKLNPRLGSGVGQQISTRWVNSGGNMYQVVETLVHHGDHESLMNPEERRENPLIS